MKREFRLATAIHAMLKEAVASDKPAPENLHARSQKPTATKTCCNMQPESKDPNHQTQRNGMTVLDSAGTITDRIGASGKKCKCGHSKWQHRDHKTLEYGKCQWCGCQGYDACAEDAPLVIKGARQKEANAKPASRSERMMTAIQKVAMNKEANPLLIGGGIAAAGALGIPLASNVASRIAWGDKARMVLPEGQEAQYLAQVKQNAEADREAKLNDMIGAWTQQPNGSYINKNTFEEIDPGEFNKRMGVIKQQADQGTNAWLRRKLDEPRAKGKFDPTTGTFVPGKMDLGIHNPLEADRDEWMKKMNSPSTGLQALLGGAFMHNGSLYFKRDNPYRLMFGGSDPFQGPAEQQKLNEYYLGGRRTFFGAPL